LESLFRVFDFKGERASLLRPSVLSLVVANLFPVLGVLFLRWDVFLLLVLFWTENLVIGVYTVLKMLFASTGNAGPVAKAFYIPFFCVHYGVFTLVHGIFVLVLFGGFLSGEPSFPGTVPAWQQVMQHQLGWGVLALFFSHGISFFSNYLRGGEYRRSSLSDLMRQPYGRVVILHLTIIFSGFLLVLLGSPAVGLLLLIAIKTAVDIRAHQREHAKYRTQPADIY